MPLELHELTTDDEFGPIVAAEYAGYAQPFNGFWEILKGPTQGETTARQLSWHKPDPSSHWLYVKNTETQEVIGGMQWNIHEANPYANGPLQLPAYWLPEGNLKNIADQLLVGFFAGRPSRMSKPHLLISYCFVKPSHRHRGAASLMTSWGTKKADELGLESYVESTEDGQGFYEGHGFKVFDHFYLDIKKAEPEEEFKRLTKELALPLHGLYMWRPKGGKSDEAKPSLN